MPSKHNPGCKCCGSVLPCSCSSCLTDAPCCLVVHVDDDWANEEPDTFPCFSCDEVTTARPIYLYITSPPADSCFWIGTFCSSGYRVSVCDRTTCWAWLLKVSGDWILRVSLGWAAGPQLALYEVNLTVTQSLGSDESDCINWKNITLTKVSDDGQCVYSHTITLSAGSGIKDYCPKQGFACGYCYLPAGTPPASFDLMVTGIADDGCDCEAFFDATHFQLDCCGSGDGSACINACCWEWVAESGSELCGPGCDDTDSDTCLNWIRFTMEFAGGLNSKAVVKFGRRHAGDADVVYAQFEKGYTGAPDCTTLSESSGWTLVTDSADSRNRCDWSGVQLHLAALESIFGCAPRVYPCHYCEDAEQNSSAFLINIPTGVLLGVGGSECTDGNCQLIEGNSYQVDFVAAEDLGFYNYCRYGYTFPADNPCRSYGDDGTDYCGQFGGDGGHRFIWRSIAMEIQAEATGVKYLVTIQGCGFSLAFRSALQPWIYSPTPFVDPKYIDCSAGPIELKLIGIGGIFGTGCSWDGTTMDAGITGSETPITLELA